LKQSSSDQLPADRFGIRLYMNVRQDGNQISGVGDWVTGPGVVGFQGSGPWDPATQTASLRFQAKGFLDVTLSGVRLWKVRGDGVHLRADRITIRGLGQSVQADLHAKY
jgi:hypothetical protein